MTLVSGYLITEDADVALGLFDRNGFRYAPREDDGSWNGIRYAARLSDGRGLAAFDADRALAFELGNYGQILNEVTPDHPDTWPDWATPRGPKRQAATGTERFILYPVPTKNVTANAALDYFAVVYEPKAAALVWDAAKVAFYVLIEDDENWTGPEDSVWDCTTTEYRDVRLEVSA